MTEEPPPEAAPPPPPEGCLRLTTLVEYAQERATQITERAEVDAKRIRLAAENDIEPAWRELRSVLGLGPAASPWEVKAAIRKVREEAEGKAERELIRWFVERAKSLIPEGQ